MADDRKPRSVAELPNGEVLGAEAPMTDEEWRIWWEFYYDSRAGKYPAKRS